MDWGKFEAKPLAIRRWARARTKLLVNWRQASPKSVHALEGSNGKDMDEADLEELHSFLLHLATSGTAITEELHAFFREKHAGQANSRQRGGGGQATERRAAREALARDARDAKCH